MYLLHARFWKLRIVRDIIFMEEWRLVLEYFEIVLDEFRKLDKIYLTSDIVSSIINFIARLINLKERKI